MGTIRYYIGLSLSLCVQDILDQRVEPNEISAIVTSTAMPSKRMIMREYYEGYWSNHDKRYVKHVLDLIWPLICQPRLKTGLLIHRGHTVGRGFWLNTSTGELTHHLPETFSDQQVSSMEMNAEISNQ